MHRQSITALPRRVLRRGRRLAGAVLRRSRRVAGAVLRRVRPPRKKIVFVFGGRSQHWPGMGRELYEAEPVFRESVRRSAALIRERSGINLLANFEGPLDPHFFEDERLVFLGIPVMQIALAELWASKGIRPNAVMGVSLGEATAGYLAGALDRRELFAILCDSAEAYDRLTADNVVLYVHAPLAQLFEVAQRAPVWMEPIYELASVGSLLFCHAADRAAAVQYLQELGFMVRRPHEELSRPYHTSAVRQFGGELVPRYRQIATRPLTSLLYSSVHGAPIPAGGLIDPAYWHELNTLPVRVHTTMEAALRDGHTVFIQVGPHPFLRAGLAETPHGPVLVDSMYQGRGEVRQFAQALRTVRRLRREHPAAASDNWLDHFVFRAPHVARDPYSYLRQMQAAGPVHYLPAEGAWIVLEPELIEEVLKAPQVFSSRLHAPFDALLLGADPPDHTVMRTLLQPLFSPAAIAALGAATEEEGRRLIRQLPKDGAFDLVEQYGLPLAQAVIARFLGLNEAEREELPAVLGGPIYGLAYLSQLEAFCRRCLQQEDNRTGAIALLLDLVEQKALQFEEAVRLLRMLWIAGTTTTSMLLSQCLHQLLRDPSLTPQLLADDSLLHKFIEECLRLEAPESELRRITTQATTLGGKELPEGAIVMLALRAANRDPRVYDEPERIKLDRPARKHLSFGGGYHYCMGVGLARVETRKALELILPLMDRWQPDLYEHAVYFPSPHFRGLARLRVRRKTDIASSKTKPHE